MTPTGIFLEYCQQKSWANQDGLVLVRYKTFLDEFDRLLCRDACTWPVQPDCKMACISNEKEADSNMSYGAKSKD